MSGLLQAWTVLGMGLKRQTGRLRRTIFPNRRRLVIAISKSLN